MRVVRLAPNFRLWLTFGTTAALVALGFLVLWGIGGGSASPERGGSAARQVNLLVSGFNPNGMPSAVAPAAARQAGDRREAAPAHANNLPVLAFSGAAASAIAAAALLFPRYRRRLRLPGLHEKGHKSHRAISLAPFT